jgi:signal transduction histidine kinase
MIQLDVRSVAISTTVLFVSLVAIRFLTYGAHRAVAGYRAWIFSDLLLWIAAAFFAYRDVLISQVPSILVANIFALGGFELRDLGVRRFLGLAPQRLAILVPDALCVLAVVAIVRQHQDALVLQNERLLVLYAGVTYISARTSWSLLRRTTSELPRDVEALGIVAGLTAALAAAGVVLSLTRLHTGDPFARGGWTAWVLVLFGLVAVFWSFLSFRLASDWIETRREEALRAQRASDTRFRLLLDESPIPVIVLAPGGRIEHVNRKFVALTGLSLDDVANEERWFASASGDPERQADARRAWRQALRVAEAGAPPGAPPEMVVDFPDRPSRTLELHAQRAGDRIVLLMVDVTEVRAAMQAREAMIAEVSHDLKSPLSSILLRVEALLRSQGDPKLVRQAQAIRQSASKMVQMIRDVLDTASLDAGRMQLELAPTDVGSVIESAVEALSPLAGQRSTSIVCDVEPLADVSCDADRLGRVLTNLIGNAVKYTEAGTITVRAERSAGGVLVTVADTGTGMAPEVLPRIFERYFTTASGGEGTGLGLHIAKGIVEAHGGRIWAESEPGKGSTFFFTLPQPALDRARPSPADEAHQSR